MSHLISAEAKRLRADLASLAAGRGLSLLGSEDSAGYFEGANAEHILAELANPDGKFANGVNVLRYIPPAEWPAIFAGTSVYDATADMQAAWNAHKHIYVPRGVFRVNPDVGLVFDTGYTMEGPGRNKAILFALPQGGTTAELAAYAKGSILKRAFNPAAANEYVTDVVLRDFGVVMNHPNAAVTATEIQIAVDFRNVTRSTVDGLHVGNIAPLQGPLVKPYTTAYTVQGYGIVCGTVSSGDVAYAGGEVNTIRRTAVWGAFKAIAIDDNTLSPLSSAHATKVECCDIQAAHHVLVQETQYTTGCTFEGNTLQQCVRQPGNANPTYIFALTGYGNTFRPGYIEAGNACDYICRLFGASHHNDVRLGDYSATSAAVIQDQGTRNKLAYAKNTGSILGGVDSFGAPVDLYNRAPRTGYYKGRYDTGSTSFVVDASDGITISKASANPGDYWLNLDTAQPNANWIPRVWCDGNASQHGVMVSFDASTQSATRIRFFTYVQNAGVSTTIEPRRIFASFQQAE